MQSSFHTVFKSCFFWLLTCLSISSTISLSMFLYLSSWLSDLSFISSIYDWSANTSCFSYNWVCAKGFSLIFFIWNFLGIMIGELSSSFHMSFLYFRYGPFAKVLLLVFWVLHSMFGSLFVSMFQLLVEQICVCFLVSQSADCLSQFVWLLKYLSRFAPFLWELIWGQSLVGITSLAVVFSWALMQNS